MLVAEPRTTAREECNDAGAIVERQRPELAEAERTTCSANAANAVGVGGLEPPASTSQTWRASQLRYTPKADRLAPRRCHMHLLYGRAAALASRFAAFPAGMRCRPSRSPTSTPLLK
jgi:hypothetical protein